MLIIDPVAYDESTIFPNLSLTYEPETLLSISNDAGFMPSPILRCNIEKIEAVSNKTSELINSGIELSSNTIQYTYSNLPSLKQSLIEKATQDASERANKIVNTADGAIGKLKSASMGVFQITGQGSTEEDSYGGINDIYSKNKTARITVRLEYGLE